MPCHGQEIYWASYLSVQTITQINNYFFKNVGPKQDIVQNGIYIT